MIKNRKKVEINAGIVECKMKDLNDRSDNTKKEALKRRMEFV